jgi:hypothetical protein
MRSTRTEPDTGANAHDWPIDCANTSAVAFAIRVEAAS